MSGQEEILNGGASATQTNAMTTNTPRTEPRPSSWFRKIVAVGSQICAIGMMFWWGTVPGIGAEEKPSLDNLVGQPAELSAWAYAYRADLRVQEKPEAYFIPRRLDRIDKVYRTAFTALPQDQLKSIYYNMPDLLKPLLPPPKGRLQAGLLWTGGLSNYQVELRWPASVQDIPSPNTVEVRAYPTSFGWFGWTVDRILNNPVLSADRRTWTYTNDPTAKMDSAYSVHVDAATEMVAVFYEDEKSQAGIPNAVPSIRVTGPSVGEWKRMDLEVEWGF